MNQTDSVSVNPAGSFSGNCNGFEMAGTLDSFQNKGLFIDLYEHNKPERWLSNKN